MHSTKVTQKLRKESQEWKERRFAGVDFQARARDEIFMRCGAAGTGLIFDA
jgi:hypothetical protein